jgi:hypothetical protein
MEDLSNPHFVDIEKITVSIGNTYVSNNLKLLCAKVDGIPANTIIGEIYGHILTERVNDAIELGLNTINTPDIKFDVNDPNADHFNRFAHYIEGK